MRLNSQGISRSLLCSSAVLIVFAGLDPASAHAQTNGGATPGNGPAASDSNLLPEIIVTATRRTETLQKTAAAVTVLTADALVSAGVTDMDDLGKLVPNLSFDTGYRAGVPQVALRGIPTAQGGEAPVAFIVDGAQAPGLDFINQDLLELESVQVLSGPQGALYGRGAIGGAIVVTTKQPTDEFHDSFSAVYGNGDLGRITNTASGPIVPGKLWAGLTLQAKTFGGLIDDIGTGKRADWNRGQAGRLHLLYKPTDTTTLSLSWSRTQGVEGASYIEIVPHGGVADFSTYKPNRNINASDKRRIDSVVGRIDQETSFGTFTSISQLAQSKSATAGEGEFSPAPIAQAYNAVRVRAFNEDVRFTSPTDRAFQWLVGAFYQNRDTVNFLDVSGEAAGPLAGVRLAYSDQDSKSVAYAAYGQASYDFSGGVRLTGALRYDVDERDDVDRSVAGTAISARFSALQPSATLSKQWNDDVLTYATVGKGFRSGGFNAFADTQTFPGVIQRKFPEETNVNYEVGFKSQWLDRSLTVNATLFHTNYSNEQYFLINVAPPVRSVVTLKSVKIDGGELSVRYLPTHALQFGLDVGAAYSNINSDDGIGAKGKYSPNAPLYTANANVEYSWEAFADYELNARADYQYRGPVYYDPANTVKFDPVGFVNLRLALENGTYSFALWGKNVTDTQYPLFFNPNAFGPGVGGREPNMPASFGIEFRYNR